MADLKTGSKEAFSLFLHHHKLLDQHDDEELHLGSATEFPTVGLLNSIFAKDEIMSFDELPQLLSFLAIFLKMKILADLMPYTHDKRALLDRPGIPQLSGREKDAVILACGGDAEQTYQQLRRLAKVGVNLKGSATRVLALALFATLRGCVFPREVIKVQLEIAKGLDTEPQPHLTRMEIENLVLRCGGLDNTLAKIQKLKEGTFDVRDLIK